MTDNEREIYQRVVRENREAFLANRKQAKRSFGQRVRDLILGRPAVTAIRVTPKGSRERCSQCQEVMIAGQPFIGRRLLCGPCSAHAQGNAMPPQRRADDEPPHAA